MQAVYWLLNTITGHVYVGSAVDITRRWTEHRLQLNRGQHINEHLQRAWNKYGEAAFTFEVLEVVDDVIWLKAREQAWILRTECQNPRKGYNSKCDAWTPSACRVGMKHSEEARANMRKAWERRKLTHGMPAALVKNQFVKGQVAPNKGKQFPTEAKEAMSRSAKLSWTSERREEQAERGRHQVSIKNPATVGRKLSEDHKRKLREAWQKRHATAQYCLEV